jgi:hypothetical protein
LEPIICESFMAQDAVTVIRADRLASYRYLQATASDWLAVA